MDMPRPSPAAVTAARSVSGSTPSLAGGSSSERPAALPSRPKRSQISRACNWCRVHRTKCDDEQPCRNCRLRGIYCVSDAAEIRTLPQAFREVERLKSRIKELELELEQHNSAASATFHPQPHLFELASARGEGELPTPSTEASSIEYVNQAQQGPSAAPETPTDYTPSPQNPWGIYASNGQTAHKQWFGPSSLVYFIGRMTSHLANFLSDPPAQHAIHFSPSSNALHPDAMGPQVAQKPDPQPDDVQPATRDVSLTAMQEEYFLEFFWQSHHCTLQIISEASFREHYKSLWTGSEKRKASALVDIILALCIQYDTVSPPQRDTQVAGITKDIAFAGRWHYQRCQTLLIPELESPSLSTLQCQILSVVYLCNASFQNMAYSSLAVAVRTAHMLGLHLEPSQHLPRPELELRKRLWWSLYGLESKTCMKLGRPWSAPTQDITCSLPADDHQLAIQSGHVSLARGNVTWLTYTVQNIKLILAARDVYIDFYNECSRSIRRATATGTGIYANPVVLEHCAVFLKSKMGHIDAWVRDLPEALKNPRSGEGRPLSLDGTELEMESLYAPIWLQRQRLFLELLYHNLNLNLYRPFISFSPDFPGAVADECAEKCVGHAIALAQSIWKALSKTNLLAGWHEGFQWEWNAAITIIGFVLARPLSPSAPAAWAAIDSAIHAFELFGRHFATGDRAATIVRQLSVQVERFLGTLRGNHISMDKASSRGTDGEEWLDSSRASDVIGSGAPQFAMQDGTFDDSILRDVLNGTVDMAFSVDSSLNYFNVALEPGSFSWGGG